LRISGFEDLRIYWYLFEDLSGGYWLEEDPVNTRLEELSGPINPQIDTHRSSNP
jgi:hypothetical protein